MNLEGYENLCSLVSFGQWGFYRKPRIDKKLLFEKSEGPSSWLFKWGGFS